MPVFSDFSSAASAMSDTEGSAAGDAGAMAAEGLSRRKGAAAAPTEELRGFPRWWKIDGTPGTMIDRE